MPRGTQTAQQTQQMTMAQANSLARQAILARSVDMVQQIYSAAITTPGTGNNLVTVYPRNVGLIKGFYVEVSGTLVNTTTVAITPTELNVANVLSNVAFYDLNNNLRINTTGWHLAFVQTAKRRRPEYSAFTNDNPFGFGNNIGANGISNIGTIAGTVGLTSAFKMLYYIPLAYSERDLRGSIYANVVNATMSLVMTINPTPTAASGDSTLAIGKGSTGTLTNVGITVYQCYLDQIPMGQNGPVLPIMDLSTIYELKTPGALTGLAASQDFPIPYANFRDFLATYFIVDNGGTLNPGTDLAYIALQSANFTNIIKVDPYLFMQWTRQEVQTDFPTGTYYFPHRKRPISTIQFGNMELILNLGTVNSGCQIMVAYEDFATVNTVTGAGSLPAG